MRGEQWGDQDEVRRWALAAEQVSLRLSHERGVDEQVAVVVGYGALWVEYGQLRLRVAGPHPDLLSEDALFEDIDEWVAFQREAGPGRVLDRDLAVLADVRAQMPVGVALWSRAAERVLADLHATTECRWTCRLLVRDDEPVHIAVPDLPVGGAVLSVVAVDVGPFEGLIDLDGRNRLPRHPLALPQLWLDCDAGWAVTVDEFQDDVEAACLEVVEHVTTDLEDEGLRWPLCPSHSDVLEPALVDGRARWVCGAGDVHVPVGSLTADLGTDASDR